MQTPRKGMLGMSIKRVIFCLLALQSPGLTWRQKTASTAGTILATKQTELIVQQNTGM